MIFSHPLARHAKVWAHTGLNGETHDALVVITTLELEPQSKRFNKAKVETLRDAVQAYLKVNPQNADGFLLMNRPKDWRGDKGI